MNYWFLVAVCGAMFLLQMALGMMQSKAFSQTFVALRRQGDKVATGKHKALFSAGAIVMFAVTKQGTIISGKSIKGVTIFARFKDLNAFNGQRISDLDKVQLRDQSPAIQKAIANAVESWVAVHNGLDPVEPPEAFIAFITQVQNKVKAIRDRIRGPRVAVAK